VYEFCGTLQDAPVYRGNACIPVLRYYLEREAYDIPNADELTFAEEDMRLNKILIEPMDACRLLQQFEKCDVTVLRSLCQVIAKTLADLFLDVIQSPAVPKQFTDWGSLLLSKQVRVVQSHLHHIMQEAMAKTSQDEAVPLLSQEWERLSQAVTILQLEKPSDWLTYYQPTSVLAPQELQSILQLRVDFSADAIGAVVAAASAVSTR
jgi:hypothetical protein